MSLDLLHHNVRKMKEILTKSDFSYKDICTPVSQSERRISCGWGSYRLYTIISI